MADENNVFADEDYVETCEQPHDWKIMRDVNKYLELKHKSKRSTIIIDFFNTEEMVLKKHTGLRDKAKQYKPDVADIKKKNFANNMCIKPGETFVIEPKNVNRDNRYQDRGRDDSDRYTNQRDFNRKRD